MELDRGKAHIEEVADTRKRALELINKILNIVGSKYGSGILNYLIVTTEEEELSLEKDYNGINTPATLSGVKVNTDAEGYRDGIFMLNLYRLRSFNIVRNHVESSYLNENVTVNFIYLTLSNLAMFNNIINLQNKGKTEVVKEMRKLGIKGININSKDLKISEKYQQYFIDTYMSTVLKVLQESDKNYLSYLN